MTSSWDIDEIRALNPLLPGQVRSQIDHLLGVAATSEDELCELAEWHEDIPENRVLCVFQLPFAFADLREAVPRHSTIFEFGLDAHPLFPTE